MAPLGQVGSCSLLRWRTQAGAPDHCCARSQHCSAAVYVGPGSSASPVSCLYVVECILLVNRIIVRELASHFRFPPLCKACTLRGVDPVLLLTQHLIKFHFVHKIQELSTWTATLLSCGSSWRCSGMGQYGYQRAPSNEQPSRSVGSKIPSGKTMRPPRLIALVQPAAFVTQLAASCQLHWQSTPQNEMTKQSCPPSIGPRGNASLL
jgi:hypothetical protein